MSSLYIGVMSGTSLDGIDIALCEINATACKLIHSHEYPFPKELKEHILNAITEKNSLSFIGQLDTLLGQLFADSVVAFLTHYKIEADTINAIGLHGQTLWHEPNGETPFSMQLGNANIMVAQTGIQTVSDFRGMDIANGGQGAPFAPAFHQFLFHTLSGSNGVLNIGGMANITLLQEELLGWDTGCGNVLLDYWINATSNRSFDRGGAFAQSGRVHQPLLNAMLEDSYFTKLPPKSTGREYFNAQWLERHLQNSQELSAQDIQRTLLELTARTISDALIGRNLRRLIVCGGGSKNNFLMQRLEALNSCEVISSDTLGVNSDALEAMAFSWLAYKRVKREEVSLKSVTGAEKNSLLGAIYG